MGGREIWAELRGGGEEEEEKKRGKQRGGGEERRPGGQQRAPSVQTPLSPLLVPTNTHLQLPPSTGETREVSGVRK